MPHLQGMPNFHGMPHLHGPPNLHGVPHLHGPPVRWDMPVSTGPLRRLDVLPDGTVRQQSPVSGTVVWTVPGRSHRPLPRIRPPARPLDPADAESACPFCASRYLETTPEKARLVTEPLAGPVNDHAAEHGTGEVARLVTDPGAGHVDSQGVDSQAAEPTTRKDARLVTDPINLHPARTAIPTPVSTPVGAHEARARHRPSTSDSGGPGWQLESGLTAEQVIARPAEVRRIPNLFEILPLSFWQAAYPVSVPAEAVDRARAYVSTELGRRHVRDLLRIRRMASGGEPVSVDTAPKELAEQALGLFAGTHDLVIARRHFVADATDDDQLCSTGDLTPQEHQAFLAMTVETLRDLAGAHPFVRYVSVFQNWLAPAGASLEHLHKQLVAIDDHGPLMARVIDTLGRHPDLFNSHVVDPAQAEGLVIASNDHALALAGVGHRYPTVELYCTSPANRPWEQSPESMRAMSDLLHACHAATGRLVPTNEEWHYRPAGVATPMPWRINLKWRVSTLAGFEGGTKINVNTISPFELRERMVGALTSLRAEGRIVPVEVGDECQPGPAPLRYREG